MYTLVQSFAEVELWRTGSKSMSLMKAYITTQSDELGYKVLPCIKIGRKVRLSGHVLAPCHALHCADGKKAEEGGICHNGFFLLSV